jgi:hypothetical protein
MPKKVKPVIDITDAHESAHHSRFTPDGITIHMQRAEPGRDGAAIGPSVEIIGFDQGGEDGSEYQLINEGSIDIFLSEDARKTLNDLRAKHAKSRPMSAREAAAKAMGKK